MILLTLTFFDDCLICHNNVVVYMLKEKKIRLLCRAKGRHIDNNFYYSFII